MLKIPMQASDTESERTALSYWDGDGAPRLLRADPESGALLIDWIEGHSVAEDVGDAASLEKAGALLHTLHRRRQRVLPALPTLEEKVGPLRRIREQEELRLGRSAVAESTRRGERSVRNWLTDSTGAVASVVLHGDLHPRNVLLGSSGKLTAVDPFGTIGDPARDVAYFGLMFREDAHARDRIEALAALAGADPARSLGHAYLIAIGAFSFRRVYGIPRGLRFLRAFIDSVEPEVRTLG